MTLVTEVLDRAARQVSIDPPDNWANATETEHVELRDDFLLETVDDVLERVDLPSPIGKQTTITGDGSESYDLPSDFKRLNRDAMAVYQTTNTRQALSPVVDDGMWTHLKTVGVTGSSLYYRVQGYDGAYTISILSEPSASSSITVSYVSTLWMADSGGTAGSAFTDAGDVLLMPRRVLEAGIVARWRERKGLPAQDKMAEYTGLLTRLINDRRGLRKITFGRGTEIRGPWDIPVPDFIPPT